MVNKMLRFYNICQQLFVFTRTANAQEKSKKYKHQNSLNSHQSCVFPQRISNHPCLDTVICSLPSPVRNFFTILLFDHKLLVLVLHWSK